ncbi:MAG: TolC family protein [Flavobacteriaceae bacterium]
MIKKHILTFLLLITYGWVFSQETTKSFSLDEAIEYALEHNYKVINAKREIEAAKKQKWETTATGLPQINASIEYQNFLKLPVTLLPAAAFDNTEAIINTVEDYFGLTPTSSPDPVEGFIPISFGTKQNMNATATLSQLIFDGSYLVGLQSAKVFIEISKNAKVKTDQEIKKLVIDAYGNVLLTEESIEILKGNESTLLKNLEDTKKTYENGLAEEESVEQLQITLLGVQSNLKNMERLKSISYKMLNTVLGIDITEKIILNDNLETLTTQNIDLGLFNTPLNLESNIDFKIAKNNERSKELLFKYEKSKALPNITAFLNGGYTGNSDSFSFLEKDQRWFGSSIVGVSLNVPVFSSLGRSAKTQRAKINFEQAKTELTEIEQQLKLQAETAKSNYQFAIEQYQTSKDNLELARRIEKKNQIKFTEGIGTSFELRQAQLQLYSSQQEYLKAMLEVINKKATLEIILDNVIIE